MRVVSKIAQGAVSLSDVQIQSSVSKLGFDIVLDPAIAGSPVDDVTVRLRHISAKGGTKVLIEKMPLVTLWELAASGEGFFQYTGHRLRGSIGITPNGKALDISGGYLSLDVDTAGHVSTVVNVNAIDAPALTSEVIYYNPVLINGGITKEISLLGVSNLCIPVGLVENGQLDFPERTVTLTDDELALTCMILNDLVCVQEVSHVQDAVTVKAFQAHYGYFQNYIFPTGEISRMTVTPSSAAPFYIYLVESKTV